MFQNNSILYFVFLLNCTFDVSVCFCWSDRSISFSLSGSTELSYQVGDLENFSSVWAGSLGNMDADLVSQVFEKQTVAEQIGVLNAAWGNDWLIL